MNIVLFGPAGSGKGTQAELLSKQMKLFHFSSGEALRAEVAKNTALGRKVSSIINKGALVPDELIEKIMMGVLNNALSKKNVKGIIFDGFPRNALQAKRLTEHFKIDVAIEIKISDKKVIERISSRRVCPKCKKNYNIIWLKPKVQGICDVCGTSLKVRDDDKPEEIKKRLSIYKKLTIPMKKELKKVSALFCVDGTRSIEDVNRGIIDIIEGMER